MNRNGKLWAIQGVRRYPIGYDAKSESAVTGLSVHFSGPYISDAERHGASQTENLNDHILTRRVGMHLWTRWLATCYIGMAGRPCGFTCLRIPITTIDS